MNLVAITKKPGSIVRYKSNNKFQEGRILLSITRGGITYLVLQDVQKKTICHKLAEECVLTKICVNNHFFDLAGKAI